MSKIKKMIACDLVIFGAKGDLAKRKLLPSLYQLEKLNYLHKDSRVIGVGRANWNKDYYSKIVYESLKIFIKENIDETIWLKLKKRLYFCNLDVYDTENFKKLKILLDQKKRVTINYFAMPPSTFKLICKGLAKAKLNYPPTRIIMEKPLGNSLKTFIEINNKISKFFQESQIFRIDHYLGKETILNLLTLRFANFFFLNHWNNKNIDHVQITVAEDVGVEGRSYFNEIGQMRDMIQNHLLQILSIIAMSPPIDFSADNIRDEKVKILNSISKIDYDDINNIVLGQYKSGFIKGKKVSSYLEEDNSIYKNSLTETFVAIKLKINNENWDGVPFYLRSGKRLPYKSSEIAIYFKNSKINLFKNFSLPKNKLIIRLQPNEGIDIHILNKIPNLDLAHDLKMIKLNFNYNETFKNYYIADGYERLLLEAMLGRQTLFVRYDEVKAAWDWVDSITSKWDKKKKLKLYRAGTWGPKESLQMLKNSGRSWNLC